MESLLSRTEFYTHHASNPSVPDGDSQLRLQCVTISTRHNRQSASMWVQVSLAMEIVELSDSSMSDKDKFGAYDVLLGTTAAVPVSLQAEMRSKRKSPNCIPRASSVSSGIYREIKIH